MKAPGRNGGVRERAELYVSVRISGGLLRELLVIRSAVGSEQWAVGSGQPGRPPTAYRLPPTASARQRAYRLLLRCLLLRRHVRRILGDLVDHRSVRGHPALTIDHAN